MPLEPHKIRLDFPILDQEVNGYPLVYLDNGASSQKPKAVIDAVSKYYEREHSNIHRGVHALSGKATEKYEEVREKVKNLINAEHNHEIIFTRGTTESINLLANCMGRSIISAGDEIIVTELEHHSNIVPWQFVCEEKGAILKVIPVDDMGNIDLQAYSALISDKTKVVAVAHVSNTLGTVLPLKEIIGRAHDYGALVVIDGAQAVPHMAVDVQALNADFYCFSSHKMFGPTGVGVLYGKEDLLNELPPYHGGGNMISRVSFEKTEYNDLPHKFEAGTPNIAGGIGLGAAVDYINALGYDNIQAYEQELFNYALKQLRSIDGLRFIGEPDEQASVISFLLKNHHPFDVGSILDKLGIAVRTGHHCTQPLMDRFGIAGTVRASFSFYNTKEEVDKLVDGIEKAGSMLG
ncbi:MAG: cysteine desulfurase [Flavobacteriales bacterium]|nr:cysteine desulfurase [Flavobacteriales bacterium]